MTSSLDLDLETAGVAEVSAALSDGSATSAALVEGYLTRIARLSTGGPAVTR